MERSEHAAIKIEATAPQSICAGAASPAANAWWLFCALVFAIKLLAPLAGSNAKTLHGRLGQLHSYGADRLDSKGSILLLRLPGTLAGGLAAQFYSAFGRSGARQRCNSDRVCADLQPLLRNVEQAFVFVRINVRAGSLSACLGAVRDDRDL